MLRSFMKHPKTPKITSKNSQSQNKVPERISKDRQKFTNMHTKIIRKVQKDPKKCLKKPQSICSGYPLTLFKFFTKISLSQHFYATQIGIQMLLSSFGNVLRPVNHSRPDKFTWCFLLLLSGIFALPTVAFRLWQSSECWWILEVPQQINKWSLKKYQKSIKYQKIRKRYLNKNS